MTRLWLVALALLGRLPAAEAQVRPTTIVNAMLIDGSGAPARPGAIRFQRGLISAVGAVRPLPGDSVIDARGLVLAPGFIDTHSHHDWGADRSPGVPAATSQGITTIIVGQDGSSPIPLAKTFARMRQHPLAVNIASYVGHNSIRDSVMGKDFQRAATPAEVERMRRLVVQEMAAGALGLSTGLEYDPGIFSTRDEVVTLARAAAGMGGRYISHIRSEDRWFWEAIDELLDIGRETGMPVQVSHTKLAMKALWGRADSLIAVLDAARSRGIKVTADIYPYTYWLSSLTVLFPRRNFTDSAEAEFVLAEVSPADGLLLNEFGPDTTLVGKTVAEVAALRGTTPGATLRALIKEALDKAAAGGNGEESVLGTSMIEADIARIMRWPFTNISSDGQSASLHPRGFGAFPRVLGRYVREQGVLSLPEAIRKMTSLPAANVGLGGRGTLRAGYAADLVLFDPAAIVDRATTRQPLARSEGISAVWVNGERVYADGGETGARPGKVLLRRR
jgi:N-acyl-D-amino-acid deacylase